MTHASPLVRLRTRAVERPPGLPLAELAGLVRDVAADAGTWAPRLQLPVGRERWWTRLSADDAVDVWLLSWLPGQTTELHDHGHSAAAFTVVRGRLAEVRVDRHGRRSVLSRTPGTVTWLAPGVVHDVRGAGDAPAVSVHAYSPPLTRMNYYDENTAVGLRIVRTVETDQPEEAVVR